MSIQFKDTFVLVFDRSGRESEGLEVGMSRASTDHGRRRERLHQQRAPTGVCASTTHWELGVGQG